MKAVHTCRIGEEAQGHDAEVERPWCLAEVQGELQKHAGGWWGHDEEENESITDLICKRESGGGRGRVAADEGAAVVAQGLQACVGQLGG